MTDNAHVHVWLDVIVDVNSAGTAVTQKRCILCHSLPDAGEPPGDYECDTNPDDMIAGDPQFDFQQE